MTATRSPSPRSSDAILRVAGLFPAPVLTAQTDTTGFFAESMVRRPPKKLKSAPAANARDA
jgi:hypothetical protein